MSMLKLIQLLVLELTMGNSVKSYRTGYEDLKVNIIFTNKTAILSLKSSFVTAGLPSHQPPFIRPLDPVQPPLTPDQLTPVPVGCGAGRHTHRRLGHSGTGKV